MPTMGIDRGMDLVCITWEPDIAPDTEFPDDT